MQNEPRWLTADEAVVINGNITRLTGEPDLLRDRALLESACATPQNRWSYADEPDVIALATGLLVAVARNHPFVQGNKRTGFIAALTFMEFNGWTMNASYDDVVVAEAIVSAIADELGEENLCSILAGQSRQLGS